MKLQFFSSGSVAACLQLMSHIYACIICAEINRSYYSHGSRYHYNLRLYAHVMPVFSIDAPAVSGVVLELWPAFGIAMPAYSRTEGYGRTFVVP